MQNLLTDTATAVITSVIHNALPLSLAILTAALMKVYIDTDKMQKFLMRKKAVPVFASVAVGAVTPLCACGTMALVLGLLTTTLPWAPIMAFLTSSPLMSPDGFIMLAGVVGVGFAVALLVSSVVIGLGSGLLTGWLESNTGWLNNQSRFTGASQESGTVRASCSCGVSANAPTSAGSCGCGNVGDGVNLTGSCGCGSPTSVAASAPMASFLARAKLDRLVREVFETGIKQILLYYMLFVAIGYMINRFVPQEWIMGLFSANSLFSVPLAAAIGLPLYITGDAAVPLIKSLMTAGAGGGAMLAFMITGQATSAWVIAGIATFMKRRAVSLYLAYIVVGGIGMGYLYDLLLRVS